MAVEKVEFKNKQGLKLVGVIHIPSKKGPFPIIVIAHGLGTGKKGTAKNFAEELLKQNFAVLRFDMRGHGESEGKIEELTPLTGVDDLKSALDFVETLKYINKNKIGVMGSSYGGNVALFLATKDKRIKILGLKSPVSDYTETRKLQLEKEGMAEWKKEGIKNIKGKYNLSYKFYEDSKKTIIYSLAKKIKVPTLIVHGDKDITVPINQSKKIFELLTCEKKLEIIKGGDHSFKTQPKNYERCINLIVNWFKKWA